jgi:hypothetical protein
MSINRLPCNEEGVVGDLLKLYNMLNSDLSKRSS